MKVVKVTEQILAAKKIDGIQEIQVLKFPKHNRAFYRVTNYFIFICPSFDHVIIFYVAGLKEGRRTILVNLSLCIIIFSVVLVIFSDIDYDFYNPQLHGQSQCYIKAVYTTLTQLEHPIQCLSLIHI